MPVVTYICPECGEKHERTADYILNGVEGVVTNREGKVVTFADPTATHRCPACREKALQKFIEEHEKENSNAENHNPEN